MSDFDTLTYEVRDGVATITLRRGDKLNAMNAAMRAALPVSPSVS